MRTGRISTIGAASRQAPRVAVDQGSNPYTEYAFQENDILLFGRESAGVPDSIQDIADARLIIPMVPGARSLNLAVSVAITAGEALRQQNLKAIPFQPHRRTNGISSRSRFSIQSEKVLLR